MAKLRKRGEQIRQFILDNVEHHPKDVSTLVSNAFGITRQAANKHIQQLVNQKSLLARGTTRNRRYILHPLDEWEKIFSLEPLAKLSQASRKKVADSNMKCNT